MSEFALNSLRYEDARQAFITYLEEYGNYPADFDFAGSNISYFIDIAGYLNMLRAYYGTLTSNNIFIDTTELRNVGVSISKSMGYRPKRKYASKFSGTLEYYGDTGADPEITFVNTDSVTIPARTIFTSAPSGLQFINLEPITLSYQNELLLSGEFVVYQGEFQNVTTFGTGEQIQSYTINSTNVEEDNLSVYIRDTNTDVTNNVQWELVNSFFTSDVNTIYFVEEDIKNEYKPKIIWGNGLLGQIPLNTETITMEYLETLGADGNGQTTLGFEGSYNYTKSGSFTFEASNVQIVIPDLQVSYGGKANETLSEIQFNAPRFYATGGKGVTTPDLQSLLSDFSSTLKYYNVIGGPELFPNDSTERGIGYIAAVPYLNVDVAFLENGSIYLTELEENQILSKLPKKTVTATIRRFLKPTYIYLELNPYIEVPLTFSASEIDTAITNALSNLQTFYDTKLVGMGKAFRYSKMNSAISIDSTITGSEMDVKHHFIITYTSFYDSRITRMNLPILFAKDTNGNVIYDDNNNPTRTNFIKKVTSIINEENEVLDEADYYSAFTLPIEKSSIYGQLSHPNSNRYMYNIDITNVDFIEFEITGPQDQRVLTMTPSTFQSQTGVEYIPNMYEVDSGDVATLKWQIQLNGRNIAFLEEVVATETFSISGVTDTIKTFLEDDIGVISQEDDTVWIKLDSITETNQNDTTREYYTLSFLLDNEVYSDVRIHSKNTIAEATFDPITFAWQWTNAKVYKKLDAGSYADVELEDDDQGDESFLKVKHSDSDIETFCSMYQYNGTFELRNQDNSALQPYSQRNDLEIEAQYTMTPVSTTPSFGFSSIQTTSDTNVAKIVLNDYQTTTITCIGNANHAIDGCWLHLYTVDTTETELPYYVWFADYVPGEDPSTSDTIDPAIPGKTGIKVNIEYDASSVEVASALASKLNGYTTMNVSNGETAGVDDFIVTLANTNYGRNTLLGDSNDDDDGGDSAPTTFSFDNTIRGIKNVNTDIDLLQVGDFVSIVIDSTTENDGYFEIESVDSANGYITVYNNHVIDDLSGTGTLLHYEILTGTYGHYKLYSYDIYHDSTIATLNYETGELLFKETVKGYTDQENMYIIETSTKNVFDNYRAYDATTMDPILITPINDYSNTNVFRGQMNDFDPIFNQSIQVDIVEPQIKK